MIITISVPEDGEGDGESVTVIPRVGDLAAVNTLPRADFAELIEAARTMLADMIANPPNIPAPPQPERPTYTPAPKIDLNAEAEKLLPQAREAVAGWDFVKSKITAINMAAHLKTSEKVGETVLKKLVEEKVLKALKYKQFGLPDPPPQPGLFDDQREWLDHDLPEETEEPAEPTVEEAVQELLEEDETEETEEIEEITE